VFGSLLGVWVGEAVKKAGGRPRQKAEAVIHWGGCQRRKKLTIPGETQEANEMAARLNTVKNGAGYEVTMAVWKGSLSGATGF
jgi:hypothetical protein